MSCAKCKHLDVKADATGRVVVRKANGYQCIAPIDMPNFPTSITETYNFQWPPRRKFMSRGEGVGCKLFVKRNQKVSK